MNHLDEWQTERSPHECVDDRVDTRVEIAQSFSDIINQQRVLDIAVSNYQLIELVRHPQNGERRGNRQAHLGDFAFCLLFGRWRRTSRSSSAALYSNLTRHPTAVQLILQSVNQRGYSTRSSATASSTARLSCLTSGVFCDISREKICWWLINHFYVIGHTEFGEIRQNNAHYAVQGHSKSPIFVPIESPYTTSYY